IVRKTSPSVPEALVLGPASPTRDGFSSKVVSQPAQHAIHVDVCSDVSREHVELVIEPRVTAEFTCWCNERRLDPAQERVPCGSLVEDAVQVSKPQPAFIVDETVRLRRPVDVEANQR